MSQSDSFKNRNEGGIDECVDEMKGLSFAVSSSEKYNQINGKPNKYTL